MASPAEPGYGLTKLFQELAELRAAVKRLEQTPPPVYVEQATVYAYTGLDYCTIQYASGATRTSKFITGYAPSPGDLVEVVTLQDRVFIIKTS